LTVTARGHAHVLSISDLPHGTRSSRGKRLDEFIDLELGDEVAAVLPIEGFTNDRFVIVATRQGQVKRTSLSEYANARATGIIGVGLARGDEVLAAFLTGGNDDVLIATRHGQAIRFREDELRPMGRAARGVKGIDLTGGDVVIAALAPRADSDLLAAATGGYGKRIPVTEFKLQGRAGKGLQILPERKRVGDLAGLLEVHPADDVAWERSDGSIVTTPAADILTRARREAGRPVIDVPAGVAIEAVHSIRSALSHAEDVPKDDSDAPPLRPASGNGTGDAETQTELGFEG